LGRLRQEDIELKASLGYKDPASKNKEKQNQKPTRTLTTQK
jgi:hypothetical protein